MKSPQSQHWAPLLAWNSAPFQACALTQGLAVKLAQAVAAARGPRVRKQQTTMRGLTGARRSAIQDRFTGLFPRATEPRWKTIRVVSS